MESCIEGKRDNCKEEEGEEIYESLVLGRGHEIVITREKEHMFDKVVTPSDVGKLNRLVIPKQYAEKYFPLDSSTNDNINFNNNKGVLLNFEDRNGKPWRFRYSYWNSSQSYVMTKGWSRFVKDKKLDAGDIVSFLRGGGGGGSGGDILFIDWRRRPETLLLPPPVVRGHHYLSFHHPYYLHQRFSPQHESHLNLFLTENPFQSPRSCMGTENLFQSPYLHSGMGTEMIQMQMRTNYGGGGGGDEIDENEERMVFESVPVVQGKAVGKRLRLFGVNMDCPISESSSSEAILSSTAVVAAGVNAPPSISSASSSSASSLMPYSYIGKPLLQKMSSDNILNKGKGSLSLDFDV